MAQKVEVTAVCDMPHDGEAVSAETITFMVDGQPMEIDVCTPHAGEFQESVGPFIAAARPASDHARLNGARPARKRAAGGGYRDAAKRQRSADIRAWAGTQGLSVSDRGRIPRDVVTRYERETGR